MLTVCAAENLRAASAAVSLAMSNSGKTTAERLPHAGDAPATPRKGKSSVSSVAAGAPASTAESTMQMLVHATRTLAEVQAQRVRIRSACETHG